MKQPHVDFVDPLTMVKPNPGLPPLSAIKAKATPGGDRSSISAGAMFRGTIQGNGPPTTDKDGGGFPIPKMRLLDRGGHDVPNIDAQARIPFAGDSEAGRGNIGKMAAWADEAYEAKLEPPGGSGWHKLVEAFEAGKVFSVAKNGEPLFTLNAFIGDPPQIFVVEHDWAGAFSGATDIDQGDYHLPYPHCAFEFRFAGIRTIMSALDIDDDKGLLSSAMIFMEGTSGCWYCGAMGDYRVADIPNTGRRIDYISRKISETIRALCIGLDAEVITREVIRAPIKLNQSRERSHKVPIPDHSVVRLAHRSRVVPVGASSDEPKWHPRLHFRRGHWRHYENHKTWIRWQLVGNPDLGFVDKQYRA
jgi:hypothetical protein